MNKTTNYLANIFFSLLLNFIVIIIGFILRRFFILYLGLEYAGINSLFNNLVSIFSLTELGIGAALTYQMYKPLKDNNFDKLSGLFIFYRKAYTIISLVVLFAGVLFSPFLKYILSTTLNSIEVYLSYYLILFNTASSYFMGYFKAILIADQKGRHYSKTNLILYLFQSLIQFILIILFKSFIFYLVTLIFVNIILNLLTRKIVFKFYTFLKKPIKNKLDPSEMKDVKKSISSMALHKLGSVLVTSTDSLIISSFIGIATVGLYSNYLLLIETSKRIINLLMENLTPSIGNLINEGNLIISKRVYFEITFFNFILNYFSTFTLFSFIQLFMELWLGDQYLLSNSIIYLICLSFYLNLSRRANIVFIDASGVFNNLKFKSFFEGFLNILFSLYFVLVINLGLLGVLLGTILSNVLSNIIIEPLFLFKYYFKQKLNFEFYSRLLFNIIITFLSITIYIIFHNFIFNNSIFIDSFSSYFLTLILIIPIVFLFYFDKNDFKDFIKRLTYVRKTIRR